MCASQIPTAPTRDQKTEWYAFQNLVSTGRVFVTLQLDLQHLFTNCFGPETGINWVANRPIWIKMSGSYAQSTRLLKPVS